MVGQVGKGGRLCNHTMVAQGSEAFLWVLPSVSCSNICQWSKYDAVSICKFWYNIATGLLITFQEMFQWFIQQVSADINFNDFLGWIWTLCRFSLPVSTNGCVDVYSNVEVKTTMSGLCLSWYHHYSMLQSFAKIAKTAKIWLKKSLQF